MKKKRIVIYFILVFFPLGASSIYAFDKLLDTQDFTLREPLKNRNNLLWLGNVSIFSPDKPLSIWNKYSLKNSKAVRLESANILNRTHLLASNISVGKQQNKKRHSLRINKIAYEIIGGVAGGMVCGCGLGSLFSSAASGNGFMAGFTEGVIGFVAGYTIGNALGVYLAGRSRYETGSFGTTLLGSILGMALGGFIYTKFYKSPWGLLPIALPPIFAVTGFNITRKYRSQSTSERSLLSFKEGQVRVDIPLISVQPDPLGSKRIKYMINMANVEF